MAFLWGYTCSWKSQRSVRIPVSATWVVSLVPNALFSVSTHARQAKLPLYHVICNFLMSNLLRRLSVNLERTWNSEDTSQRSAATMLTSNPSFNDFSMHIGQDGKFLYRRQYWVQFARVYDLLNSFRCFVLFLQWSTAMICTTTLDKMEMSIPAEALKNPVLLLLLGVHQQVSLSWWCMKTLSFEGV